MKRLLTALLALLGLLGAPACFAIGPYLAGTAMPAGELPALMAQLEQKLRADGFNVVGRHLPRGLPQQGSIVVTDAKLLDAVRAAGGPAIVAAAIRVGVKSDGTVSYMNPDYWGRAYLRGQYDAAQPALRSVRERTLPPPTRIRFLLAQPPASDMPTPNSPPPISSDSQFNVGRW